VRDVLFQLDPFDWSDHPEWGRFSDQLYVFGEEANNGDGWNMMMYSTQPT
jgi:hypothetical protein